MEQLTKLNALIFGSTGAVGRELVKILANSSRWNKITLVVRNQLQQWSTLQNKNKIQIHKIDTLDKLQDTKKWSYSNINSVFCCLGTRTKQGTQIFTKVDKTYPLWIADIANYNKIPHYSLVSSTGSNKNSFFLYMRIKGEVQQELKQKQLIKLSIFRPGLLKNRYDPRFGEKILAFFPIGPQIDVKQAAKCLMRQAEAVADQKIKQKINIYQNKDMLKFANDK